MKGPYPCPRSTGPGCAPCSPTYSPRPASTWRMRTATVGSTSAVRRSTSARTAAITRASTSTASTSRSCSTIVMFRSTRCNCAARITAAQFEAERATALAQRRRGGGARGDGRARTRRRPGGDGCRIGAPRRTAARAGRPRPPCAQRRDERGRRGRDAANGHRTGTRGLPRPPAPLARVGRARFGARRARGGRTPLPARGRGHRVPARATTIPTATVRDETDTIVVTRSCAPGAEGAARTAALGGTINGTVAILPVT